MRITQDTVQRIYAAIDIVEVIGDFVALKKRGANYAALSPFTNERTPSFYVSPSKQIFKCFSTGIGGDAVKFVMEVDKLSYVEALKYLANKYGIEIEYDQSLTDEQQHLQSEKEAMFIAMDFAKQFYQNQLLHTPDGKAIGMPYFKERGLNESTIKTFELGFAPDAWDVFLQNATKNAFSSEILEKVGLIKVSDNGKKFDFFRHRVIFPIHNPSGKVVAMAGRILANEKGIAKYINSPETELYHKNEVLYGLFQAKNAIRAQDNCLLVEGYMDVISLHQAGIKNIVASSGTSLTPNQCKLIGRYTQNITVLYDGDAAGIKAALRGTDLLLEGGLNVKIVVFPAGHDPDSFVQEIGAEAFNEYIHKNARDFISFKTEILLKDAGNDPVQKAKVIHEIVEGIAKVKDSVQRALYVKKCSQLLQVDEQVLVSEYNKILLKKFQSKEQPILDADPEAKVQDTLTAVSQSLTDRILFTAENPDEYTEREVVRILLEYADFPVEAQQPLYQALFAQLQEVEFKNPWVIKVLQAFQEQVMNGVLPGLDYFMQHPEKQIEEFVTHLLADRHEISPKWLDKYSIYVPEKDSDIKSLMKSVVTRLNFEKSKLMFVQNQQKLKEIATQDWALVEEILLEQQLIKKFQMECAAQIGLIISG